MVDPVEDHPPVLARTTWLWLTNQGGEGRGVHSVGRSKTFLSPSYDALRSFSSPRVREWMPRVSLPCVPRNTNCAAKAARWEQPPPAPLRPRLNNVIHQLIFISESQPRARHPRLPLGWDVTDGLNVTSALSVCVSVFLGAVVYGPFHVCASDVSAASVSLTQTPPPAALVLTCSGGSRSI